MNSQAARPATRRAREAIEYFGISLAAALVRRLPYRLLARIAWVLGGIVCHLDRRGCKAAMANLDCVFGATKTATQKRRIATASYRTFARTMLELFWAPNLTPGRMLELVSFEGLDAHPCHADPKQPVIYFCHHYSNFEWLSLLGAWRVGKAFVLTQRLKNPRLGKIFDRLRSCTGHDVIAQEHAFLRMFKHLKRGGKFFMLTDLTLDPREASVIIDCCGRKTCVTQMHAAMGLRTGALLVPVECHPRAGGGYRVKVHLPLEWPDGADALQIAQLAWNALEPALLEHPENWVWSYKHWRFRPANTNGVEYPFYANPAKRFDRKLRAQAGAG